MLAEFREDSRPVGRREHGGRRLEMWMRACVYIVNALVCLAVGCQTFESAPIDSQAILAQPQQPVLVDPALQPTQFVAPQSAPIGPVPVAPPENAVLLQPQVAPAAAGTVAPNPIFIPVTNQDWAWEQIVDVVDDYFRIERESRVQLVGNVVTEGRIDTFPQVGATLAEPHRPDSVGRYNRFESTFQTIRRRGLVRVIPEQSGYLVDLTVLKELEDLPHPENATAGAAAFRNDNSLSSRVNDGVSRTRLSNYWIPLGRDTDCEQQILAEIQARLAGGGSGGVLLK